jgi:hypothetical protein
VHIGRLVEPHRAGTWCTFVYEYKYNPISTGSYTFCGIQDNTLCSQTQFLLVVLTSHEVRRHLDRDIYTIGLLMCVCCSYGALHTATPIMLSLVTSAWSCSSLRPSVPAGRRGKTMHLQRPEGQHTTGAQGRVEPQSYHCVRLLLRPPQKRVCCADD